MTKDQSLEYVKSLNIRRKRRRMYSWGLIALGVITYLDAGWRFPIWLTGIWAFVLGTILIVIGVTMLVATYKLPIEEALLFASTQQGKITAPSLSLGMNITLETAELILDQLVKKGYAQVSTEDMEEGAVVYRISGVERFS
ncbi:hypothetical protein GF339_14135 [candidate division KSB3 bacterium]|uniref:Uncharacterized protein n=1 Tax=candidate division KSB3 bacterium TaxID=2044937 RepID=A0A9D5JXW6_9BACT|nr:hypothetical protein [candidate division KSB3 bacterium]MBD3325721.1 hypothetical protein [candidate division KSB3 bacterium]